MKRASAHQIPGFNAIRPAEGIETATYYVNMLYRMGFNAIRPAEGIETLFQNGEYWFLGCCFNAIRPAVCNEPANVLADTVGLGGLQRDSTR